MDYCLIMTTGRTGSDYLQACLDNVNGVMTFSGKFSYHNLFNGSEEKKNKSQLIEKFIKENEKIFTYDYIEDIDTGVNTAKLKEVFLNLNSEVKIDRRQFVIDLYKAYHLTVGRNINDVKVLVHHAHNVENTKVFLRDFPESKMLVTIRDPRANLKSGLENWFKFDINRIHMMHIYIYLKRIKEDLLFAVRKKNLKLFVKLEEANNKDTKKKICDFLGIKFDEKIMIATLNSKVWNGDKISQFRSKNGEYIEKVKNNNWSRYFTIREIQFLNILYKDYIKFDYKLDSVHLKDKIILFFLLLKPFSFEKDSFQKNNKKLLNNIYFLKRVLYSIKNLIRA